MTFKKWPSIENSYRERFIYPFLGQHQELNDETFVITEKLHGSNIQLYFEPNKPCRVGSRNRFLSAGDKFFDIWNTLERYQDLIAAFQRMVDKSNHTVRLFGELFGGNIQKGVKYQEEHKIAFFGLMMDDELRPFCDFDTTMVHSGFGHLVVPIIDVVRGLDSALKYNTEFDSKVLGIDNNICEGVVIQPYRKVYQSHAGEYFILKAKNEAFKEKQKEKKPVVVDSKLQVLNIEFRRYITDNRLQGIFSKYGEIQEPKQIGQYIRYMMDDAKEDFLKDFPDVCDMDKSEQKQIFNVGGTIANMLKGYL